MECSQQLQWWLAVLWMLVQRSVSSTAKNSLVVPAGCGAVHCKCTALQYQHNFALSHSAGTAVQHYCMPRRSYITATLHTWSKLPILYGLAAAHARRHTRRCLMESWLLLLLCAAAGCRLRVAPWLQRVQCWSQV